MLGGGDSFAGLAASLRAAKVDTPAFIARTLQFKDQLKSSPFQSSLSHLSPPAVASLLECACAVVHGSAVDSPDDERLTSVAELLRVLVDLMFDPSKTDGPHLTADVAPSLEALTHALVTAAHAEMQRAKPVFKLINAVWRILVRLSATHLQILGSAPASAVPLVECLLQTIAAAIGAAEPTDTAKLQVVRFHAANLRTWLKSYAPWFADAAARHAPHAAAAARTLARAYHSVSLVLCATTRRNLRATLDACVLAMLSARAADGSATATPTLQLWLALANRGDHSAATAAPAAADTTSLVASSLASSADDSMGFLLLLLAAARAPILGSRQTDPTAAAAAAACAPAVLASALPALLTLLPRCYHHLLMPPTAPLEALLDDMRVVLRRAPPTCRAAAVSSLVDASCAPHMLVRHAAFALWPYALMAFDPSEVPLLTSPLITLATRLDADPPHTGAAHARSGVLTLVATSCLGLHDPMHMARALAPVRSALTNVATGAAGAAAAAEATSGAPTLRVAVELLEALAARVPAAPRPHNGGGIDGSAPHADVQSESARCMQLLHTALERLNAPEMLRCLHTALGGLEPPAAVMHLRGLTALIRILPERLVPAEVRETLPSRLVRMLSTAAQKTPSGVNTPSSVGQPSGVWGEAGVWMPSEECGSRSFEDGAGVSAALRAAEAVVGWLTPGQRATLLRTTTAIVLDLPASASHVDVLRSIPQADRALNHGIPAPSAAPKGVDAAGGGGVGRPLAGGGPHQVSLLVLLPLLRLARTVGASGVLSEPSLVDALSRLLDALIPIALGGGGMALGGGGGGGGMALGGGGGMAGGAPGADSRSGVLDTDTASILHDEAVHTATVCMTYLPPDGGFAPRLAEAFRAASPHAHAALMDRLRRMQPGGAMGVPADEEARAACVAEARAADAAAADTMAAMAAAAAAATETLVASKRQRTVELQAGPAASASAAAAAERGMGLLRDGLAALHEARGSGLGSLESHRVELHAHVESVKALFA